MKILAIDTTSQTCSVCLFDDGEYSEQSTFGPRQHAQRILPQIKALLSEAKTNLSDLDAIAFNRGPGSFTGLRLSASVSQALAFATNKPVIAISSLQALAEQARRLHGYEQVLAAIDARMQQVYYGFYSYHDSTWHLQGEELVINPADIPRPAKAIYHAIGTGWREYPEQLTNALTVQPKNIINNA